MINKTQNQEQIRVDAAAQLNRIAYMLQYTYFDDATGDWTFYTNDQGQKSVGQQMLENISLLTDDKQEPDWLKLLRCLESYYSIRAVWDEFRKVWIIWINDPNKNKFHCDICNFDCQIDNINEYSYCPNCGAKVVK